jgi:transposase, IS30 family
MLRPFKKKVHTLTSDNGKEFAGHENVASKLKAAFYFAHPYSSWERGLNENTNGLIRQYIPKRTSFDTVTDDLIKFIEGRLNNRPRKNLNFQTPKEAFDASNRM